MGYKTLTDENVDTIYNNFIDILEISDRLSIASDLEELMNELDEQNETNEVKIRKMIRLMDERF